MFHREYVYLNLVFLFSCFQCYFVMQCLVFCFCFYSPFLLLFFSIHSFKILSLFFVVFTLRFFHSDYVILCSLVCNSLPFFSLPFTLRFFILIMSYFIHSFIIFPLESFKLSHVDVFTSCSFFVF